MDMNTDGNCEYDWSSLFLFVVSAQEYLSLFFTSLTNEALWNEKSVWASSGSPKKNITLMRQY